MSEAVNNSANILGALNYQNNKITINEEEKETEDKSVFSTAENIEQSEVSDNIIVSGIKRIAGFCSELKDNVIWAFTGEKPQQEIEQVSEIEKEEVENKPIEPAAAQTPGEENSVITKSEEVEPQSDTTIQTQKYKFEFEENMTSEQKDELQEFKTKFNENKEKYKEVERATGVPAELIAAIHWRESNGDFTTYLHNGEQLGTTTVTVPEGIFFDEGEWVAAAIDAISSSHPETIDKNNIETFYQFAEEYNGLGYKMNGMASPYVWSGTTEYQGGKYVADGHLDREYYDKQLGVAVMLKSLLE